MKKSILATGLFLVLIATMVFPAGRREVVEADLVTLERIGNPNAPNTITFAARQTLSNQASDIGEVLTERYRDWALRNPDYKIEITIMPGTGNESMARLLEQASAGRVADVALIDSFFAARFYDYLQPLDRYLPPGEIDDFVPFAREGMTGPDGSIKLLWFTTDAIALYYRNDLFDRAPRTWDEVIDFGRTATANGFTGLLFPAGRAEAAVMGPIWPNFWALGGELVDDTGRPVFGEGSNREKLLDVFGFLQRTVREGITPSAVSTMGPWTAMYPEIASGNVAMFLGGSWILGALPELLGSQQAASRYSVAAIPTAREDIAPVTANGGWTIGMFSQDPGKQAAIVDFMLTAYGGQEAMGKIVSAGSLLAPRRSIINLQDPYFRSSSYQTFAQLTENGRARPGVFIYPTISTEMQIAISEVISGQKIPSQAIQDAWQRVMVEYNASR